MSNRQEMVEKAQELIGALTEDDHAVLYIVNSEGNLSVVNMQMNDGIKLAIFNAEADAMEESDEDGE